MFGDVLKGEETYIQLNGRYISIQNILSRFANIILASVYTQLTTENLTRVRSCVCMYLQLLSNKFFFFPLSIRP